MERTRALFAKFCVAWLNLPLIWDIVPNSHEIHIFLLMWLQAKIQLSSSRLSIPISICLGLNDKRECSVKDLIVDYLEDEHAGVVVFGINRPK